MVFCVNMTKYLQEYLIIYKTLGPLVHAMMHYTDEEAIKEYRERYKGGAGAWLYRIHRPGCFDHPSPIEFTLLKNEAVGGLIQQAFDAGPEAVEELTKNILDLDI